MSETRALLSAHVAILFMGLAAVFAEVSGFAPWHTTSYRVTIGGLVLVLIWLFSSGKRLPSARICLLFLGLGFILSVHWFAFFRSIELLGVMLGSAMIGIEPLFVAGAARLVLKERLSRRAMIAMGFSAVGFLILGSGGGVNHPDLVAGVAYSVFAFAIFAVLVLCNRVWVQNESPVLLSALQMLGAIPLTLFMIEEPWAPVNAEGWVYALILGFLCTGLAYALYTASLRVLAAPIVGLMFSLEVVYGILGGWVIGDSLTPREILAALFISSIMILDVSGYVLRRRAEKRAQHRKCQVG
ncbi:DMT family transporter [Sulfidibacter corallicola]|uniref:DMT family transporter n=1 Tax=Sulfidibacter corallicola TaxID=2818388 RepID=A0A8A4TXV7_SULCO|nr:DMT family transporter [Sulfidibacter corallicola]QTD54038.1 DMT family transporter [Sulfidibacter corallicola]